MNQDSSDDESEEEEDFSRVQFGSRYSAAARCALLPVELVFGATNITHRCKALEKTIDPIHIFKQHFIPGHCLEIELKGFV